MKSYDPKNLLHKLQNVPVELPTHRRVLRKQLMTMHFAWRMTRHSPGSFTSLLQRTRIAVTSHKVIALGLTVASGLVLLLGLLLLLPISSNTQDRKLLAEGSKTTPVTRQTAAHTSTCQDDPASCPATGKVVQSQPAPTAPQPGITLATVTEPVTARAQVTDNPPAPAPAPPSTPPVGTPPSPPVQVNAGIAPIIDLDLTLGILDLPSENNNRNKLKDNPGKDHRSPKASKNKPAKS